jgi:hypothetical protein
MRIYGRRDRHDKFNYYEVTNFTHTTKFFIMSFAFRFTVIPLSGMWKTIEVTPYLRKGHSALICMYNLWIANVDMYSLSPW